MAETTREMVVRLSMDAGGFKKTASEINRQIRNIDKEIKGMGGDQAGASWRRNWGCSRRLRRPCRRRSRLPGRNSTRRIRTPKNCWRPSN